MDNRSSLGFVLVPYYFLLELSKFDISYWYENVVLRVYVDLLTEKVNINP